LAYPYTVYYPRATVVNNSAGCC